ncbi:hypothetical protein [Emcibacter sp.]|uniref:hypothetical protein n=1 Tax=Emcibacter sp. TaxID=1979954 RepID=UPI003A8D0F92
MSRNTQGYRWGIFHIRFPLLHMRIEWPELLQGLVVSISTGLALVPLLVMHFGLTFEEAIALSMVSSFLITASIVFFGEPYAPGWITPALPLALTFVLAGYDTPTERFQVMTALTIDFALIIFFLGITGLGKKLINHIPRALKAGIILGAAIAAFKRVFVDDPTNFTDRPWASGLALAACLIIAFSAPFHRLKEKVPALSFLSAMGLLPGFIIAGIAGVMLGELHIDIEWGILLPPFDSMWSKASPFAIGWPGFDMYVAAMPIAFMTYTIFFGDLLTGITVLQKAQKDRPDDPIDINVNRSHVIVSLRNALMAIGAPFFPTQGVLWTGIHVIIVERWRQGPEKMQTLFSGLSAYYLYCIPLFFLILPLITLLKPFLHIALLLTLALTGFACAYIAMGLSRTTEERGVALLTSIMLVYFDSWIGLLVGVAACLLIIGIDSFRDEEKLEKAERLSPGQ